MKHRLIILEKILFNLFVSLFLVGMFNRELNVLGLDFRVFPSVTAGLLLMVNLILFRLNKQRLQFFNQPDRKVLWFLFYSILINFMWLFNGLNIKIEVFLVVLIACTYNLFAFLIFNINQRLIQWQKISATIVVAGFILFASMVASYMGVDLRQYGSPYFGGYKDISSGFISQLRYGGYAQDPNYASLFMIIWLAVAVYGWVKYRKSRLRWAYLAVLPLAFFGFLLSSSKAILAILPLAIILIVSNRYHKIAKLIKISLLTVIFGATLVIAFGLVRPNASLTMRTRFGLWRAATRQFSVSPLMGNGLTASRSAAATNGQWYVQPHSSVVQILVDMGVIGIILIFLILKNNLNSENKLLVFLTIVFLSHFATHETIYQAYFVFIIGILPLCLNKEKLAKSKTTAVFIINGLSNGGAERVVQNMANQLCQQHQVVIYTLTKPEDRCYQLDDRIKVISLTDKLSTLSALIASWRLSTELANLSRTHRIVLLTSHLPKAHLATRLSSYDQQALYVIHGNFGIKDNFLNQTFMQFLYNHRKIITVSDGLLQGDMIQKFKVKTRSVQTIYNPVDIQAIQTKLAPHVTKLPQIVVIGRLSPPKRPDLAVQAFAKSGLAKTHKLVFLGQGELQSLVESEISKYQLQNRVELRGFVDNPFAVLQESTMMLVASGYEAFSMVIIEAMICNCPVVTFDVYGTSEALTGELSQFIVSNGDVNKLANKMRLAVKNYPKDLRSVIEPKVNPERIITKYLKVYRIWTGF